MRTSLNEIKRIEQYLSGSLTVEQRLSLEMEASKNESFRLNVFLQRKINQLLKINHRDSIRADVEHYHDKVFNDPRREHFQQRILSLFQ